jgi:hypothetical protein
MCEDHSSTDEMIEPIDQHSEEPADENPAKPFNSVCIDLTPALPTNVGYVGGVRVPKKK